MNRRVEAPGRKTSGTAACVLRLSSTKLRCVRTQPFGVPVVPDV